STGRAASVPVGGRRVHPPLSEGAMGTRVGSTVIENVQPRLDCGRYPVKRVAGGSVRVSADVIKEGHDELTVVLRHRRLTPRPGEAAEAPMAALGNDAF